MVRIEGPYCRASIRGLRQLPPRHGRRYISLFPLLPITFAIAAVYGQLCPPLPLHPYGQSLPCGTNLGDRCHFGCERGFGLIGSCHRECRPDGRWAGEAPVCINRGVQCSGLSAPVNGRLINQCLVFAGSSCAFECSPGFQLKGQSTVHCTLSGSWSAPVPSCSKGSGGGGGGCYDVNPPANGGSAGVCVSAQRGSRCVTRCDVGFRLSNDAAATITCLDGNQWSARPPTCGASLCPSQNLGIIINGRLEGQCAPGILGKSCALLCNPGFLVPPGQTSSIVCLATGAWSGSLASFCQPIKCPPLATIANGQFEGFCSLGVALQQCKYECFEGFTLVGQSTLVCQANGLWSSSAPSCVASTCRSLLPGPGMTLEGQCDPGRAGQACKAGCDRQYRLQGSVIRTCQRNNEWTGEGAICLPARCPPLVLPRHSFCLGCSSTAASGLSCRIACLPGYRFSEGSSPVSVQCNSGTWSPSHLPVCVAVLPVTVCRSLLPPVNGVSSATCTNPKAGEECFFRCNRNFRLTPDIPINTCRKDGRWTTDPPPSCTPVLCTRPVADILNGSKRGPCSPGRVGELCIFSCNTGFGLVGSPSIECLSDGQWAYPRQLPSCVAMGPIQCPALPVPENGHYDSACDNSAGSVCLVICKDGFASPEPRRFVCGPTGAWSPSGHGGRCKAINCPSISPSRNVKTSGACSPGLSGQSCDFSCASGFRLVGFPTIKCTGSGWNARPPTCQPVTCPFLSSPLNGYVKSGRCAPGEPDVTCTFACSRGFSLAGSVVLKCQGDGSWSNEPPTCLRVSCPSLVGPKSGTLKGTCSPGTAGESCSFVCESKFKLVGLTNLVCQTDGTWSGTVPECVETPWQPLVLNCPPVHAPPGGSTTGSCNPGFVGKTCALKCPPGYHSVGATIARCFSNGSWAPAHPGCQRSPTPTRKPRPACRQCQRQRSRWRRSHRTNTGGGGGGVGGVVVPSSSSTSSFEPGADGDEAAARSYFHR